ncbi:hypothetical protein [Nonomuraea typhae]|uniref:Uncharacterized protein n=1 Tax=Nonomuraea typhae TaxID=2603600 RepID=A0ABW7ZCB6_9ACTN
MVHQQHLIDWSSIHDLTGRHIAVITPDPTGSALVDAGVAARGLALFGDDSVRPFAVTWRSSPPAYALRLPRPIDEHATAVTAVATELQEYFGIAEDALPCVVIVCTREQQAVVIGLNRRITVYGLLRHVKSALEPQLAWLNQISAELDVIAREKREAEDEHYAAVRRANEWRTALSSSQEWANRRQGLAEELVDFAADVDTHIASSCRWLAARLAEDQALNYRAAERADALLAKLRGRIGNLSHRKLRSLRRRLRRVVVALGTNVAPEPEVSQKPDDDELAILAERVSRTRAAYDPWGAQRIPDSRLHKLTEVWKR